MQVECDCCKAVNDHGHSIELEGSWVLNHWGGKDEKYLGRLVLQTKCHRQNWNDLSLHEATNLGINIQRINVCLRQYWSVRYLDDSIEQIYAVYFNEYPYKKGLDTNEIPKYLHVHMHLLARTRKMCEAIDKDNLGWHFVDCIKYFPADYQISGKDDVKVESLMEYLRHSLTTKK